MTVIGLIGSGGLLGRATVEAAQAAGVDLRPASRAQLDARDRAAVEAWLAREKPDALVITAAVNGGIQTNIAAPADLLDANAQIALACLGAARRAGISRVLYCASAALYPHSAPQPLREADVFAGAADPGHLGYAAAKLLGVRYCQAVRQQDGLAFTALFLTNIYGPGQRWEECRSNVVGGLLKRFHDAKQRGDQSVTVWGTGTARRDLVFGADAAKALLILALRSDLVTVLPDGVINVGSGADVSIAELSALCAETVGYSGEIVFDPTKPEGVARRLLDVSRLAATGWRPTTPLRNGLVATYADLVPG